MILFDHKRPLKAIDIFVHHILRKGINEMHENVSSQNSKEQLYPFEKHSSIVSLVLNITETYFLMKF